MDLLNGNIRKIFLKYFAAAFGSTLIMSIYYLVDMIVIGHYEGPNGTAAVADYMPMWTFLFAVGLLFGIGGSVLMAQKRGEGDKETGDQYFTTALILALFAAIIIFVIYFLYSEPLLYLFGGRGKVLTLATRYSFWLSLASPLIILVQLFIPFIRNDGHPLYTTIAVLAGGGFNIFGDIYFVFGLDMGIAGSALATSLGQVISFSMLIGYLFSKKSTLRPDRRIFRHGFLKKTGNVISMGASNFAIDLAMAVLTVLFNNQTMIYSGAAALAVYGVISTLASMVQSFGYAVGESAQAVMSVNFGARKYERVTQTLKVAAWTAVIMGAAACLIGLLIPVPLTRLYMSVTPEVLEIAPGAIRTYFIAFLFLVFNVMATYYFQSISRPKISTAISLLRGIVISGVMVFLLPAVFGVNALWLAMPVTEMLVTIYILINIRRKPVSCE